MWSTSLKVKNMPLLSDTEAEHYREQGYVVPSFRLPPQRVNQLRQALDDLITRNPGVRPEHLVSAHVENPGREGVKGSKVFLDLAMDSDLVDLAESVIGPNIALWGAHMFCKPGGDGLETPWHQDGHYWPIRPLATCTIWVALDASTRANGCLQVIPGSHKDRQLFEHMTEDRKDLVLDQKVKADAFDDSSAQALELEPGQMSMHDVYMIHGATVNRSPHRRAGLAIRYMPTNSLFDRTIFANGNQNKTFATGFGERPLWLLRGTDLHGGNDFRIGHR
jgi:Phytanoyl-CoA dioxygenase (PhyH)